MITGGPFTNGNIIGINNESQNQQAQQVQQQQQQNQQQLTAAPDCSTLLSLGREQQYAAIQLSHYVYTLLCIISQLMTTNERYEINMFLYFKTKSTIKFVCRFDYILLNELIYS